MDPRISRLSHMGAAGSRSSVAASDTTYHSFHDVELFPPASPPRTTNKSTTVHPTTPQKENQRPHPSSTEMKRQDSGYESIPPRTSFSNQPRRTSVASSSGSGPHTPRSRPCSRPGRPVIRRSPKSSPYPARPQMAQDQEEREIVRSIPSPPPQPTHYWTSDQTRRLEYAAIDAAHQGIKGWVRRHLVPECFVPREKTPVAFDDETGSVRRYRMELEEEEREGEKKGWAWARMKSW
ncbi:Vacuolar protease A [Verticillium dahliae VDG1]|nr:Vacuolar protease A [Verticillium dahliae VDG1]